MKVGVLILVGLAFASSGACTEASSPDEQCITGGGVCFSAMDMAGCGTPLELACSTGFNCCTTVYAGNFADGSVIDAPSGMPTSDGSTDGEASTDSGSSASRDAAATRDAGSSTVNDAAIDTDGTTSAVKDAAAHD